MQRAVVPGCPLLGQGSQLFLNNYNRLQDFGIDLLLPLNDKKGFFCQVYNIGKHFYHQHTTGSM
jgi:hypothetical protein